MPVCRHGRRPHKTVGSECIASLQRRFPAPARDGPLVAAAQSCLATSPACAATHMLEGYLFLYTCDKFFTVLGITGIRNIGNGQPFIL